MNRKISQRQLEEIKEQAFTDPSTATETETVGLLLAGHFEWSGTDILESCMYALEDSNFHDECEQINQMLKELKKKYAIR